MKVYAHCDQKPFGRSGFIGEIGLVARLFSESFAEQLNLQIDLAWNRIVIRDTPSGRWTFQRLTH